MVLCILFTGVSIVASATDRPAIHKDTYRVVHVYPHDPDAFTQGLVYVDGRLYESTGRNGHSTLRLVDLGSGHVLQSHSLPAEYFGEGLTEWKGTLIQLTWTSGLAFIYDQFSFAVRRTFSYAGEGWGLTHDERNLILSDGSQVLRFLDPQTFREVRQITVSDENHRAVQDLNELEYVRGEIYANVWHQDEILRISPSTGKVLGRIDLTGLINQREVPDPEAVLNGIAYDSKGDRLFVTGKLWPKLFEIKVVPRDEGRPLP